MRATPRPAPARLLLLASTAAIALLAGGCAATAPNDPARAERNAQGQAALEGMENAVLKDNNPSTPVKAKPPN
jgi:hypothetical protein